MKTIEREGKSTSSVVKEFMKEFNLQYEDFKFEIVDEGKIGFLGLFFSRPTVIRFTVSGVEDSIKNYVQGILDNMDVIYEGIQVEEKREKYFIEIKGAKEAGFLIGKEARNLDAIQHLVNQMINKQEKKSMQIELDIDGYRERKNQQLKERLKVVAEKVKKTGRSYTFEPMNAVRRKIIHKFVERENKLQTMTIGRGDSKRVVISQVGERPNSNKNDNRRSHRSPRKLNRKDR